MIENEIKLILDENNITVRPKPDWIKQKNWFCRVYFISYDRIEANFITDAITTIDHEAVEFIAAKNIEVISNQIVTVDYVNSFYCVDRNMDIGINNAGFTNTACDYLYLKDAENDMFMLFGTKDFIQKAMPVTQKEYKKYYDEHYGAWQSDNIDNLLRRIWKAYPNC